MMISDFEIIEFDIRIKQKYPGSKEKEILRIRWADKVSATDSPREENGCNYSGKISKKENKTG